MCVAPAEYRCIYSPFAPSSCSLLFFLLLTMESKVQFGHEHGSTKLLPAARHDGLKNLKGSLHAVTTNIRKVYQEGINSGLEGPTGMPRTVQHRPKRPSAGLYYQA